MLKRDLKFVLDSNLVKRNFSDFLDELGELEAKEDIDSVLRSMRRSIRNQ